MRFLAAHIREVEANLHIILMEIPDVYYYHYIYHSVKNFPLNLLGVWSLENGKTMQLSGEEVIGPTEKHHEYQKAWFMFLVDNRYVVLFLRVILSGFFLLSAYGKLVDIERYSVDAVYNFGILPIVLARTFGVAMPFIELLCGIGLLFGILTRLSALGIGLMSLSFFVAKAIMLSQGRSMECGCFGAVIDTLASVTIFMDIPVIFFAMVVMWARPNARHWKSLGNLLPRIWKEKLHLIW